MKTLEENTIDLKTKEMIALGVAYAINCKFCMEYHKRLAMEAGLNESLMRAAIQTAEGVRSGAAMKTECYAKDLFGEFGKEKCCPEGSDCCP